MRGINKFYILLFAFFILDARWGLSYVNDSYSLILNVAIPYKKKGFELREGFFKTGLLKVGQKKIIKHNALFKGNEYWFWAGFNVDGIKKDGVHIQILDRNKKPLKIEKKVYLSDNKVVGARVLIPKTGLYYITFWLDKGVSNSDVEWSLTYAQR